METTKSTNWGLILALLALTVIASLYYYITTSNESFEEPFPKCVKCDYPINVYDNYCSNCGHPIIPIDYDK